MSKQLEREIEEILRRQPTPIGSRPTPPPRRQAFALPDSFRRILTTPAEQMFAAGMACGLAAYFIRLAPVAGWPISPSQALLALCVGLVTLAVFGPPFGLLKKRETQYWRGRPIAIESGASISQRLGYTWWRLRVSVRRLFGG